MAALLTLATLSLLTALPTSQPQPELKQDESHKVTVILQRLLTAGLGIVRKRNPDGSLGIDFTHKHFKGIVGKHDVVQALFDIIESDSFSWAMGVQPNDTLDNARSRVHRRAVYLLYEYDEQFEDPRIREFFKHISMDTSHPHDLRSIAATQVVRTFTPDLPRYMATVIRHHPEVSSSTISALSSSFYPGAALHGKPVNTKEVRAALRYHRDNVYSIFPRTSNIQKLSLDRLVLRLEASAQAKNQGVSEPVRHTPSLEESEQVKNKHFAASPDGSSTVQSPAAAPEPARPSRNGTNSSRTPSEEVFDDNEMGNQWSISTAAIIVFILGIVASLFILTRRQLR